MKRALLATLICVSCLGAAEGQVARAGVTGEIVASSTGAPQSPWVERQLCRKTTGKCEAALMNPETGEVARMGDVLGTDFERSGNGEEIRRAETAMEKAVRFKAQQ